MRFFTAVIKYNFQMKNCDIYLIFAQNIDRGYTLLELHVVPAIYVSEQK